MPKDSVVVDTSVAKVYETAHKMADDEQVFAYLRDHPPVLREIGPGVALIESLNGTILVSHGSDGIVLIDCYYEVLADVVVQLLRELTEAPFAYAVPTHFHHDHAGGAGHFASLGAAIVGVKSSRERMSHDHKATHLGSLVKAAPLSRPSVTYTDELVLHLNGEEIELHHSGPAHTDTDTVIHFRKANVLHMGDVFVSGFPTYPYLDLAGGADAQGALVAVERALSVANEDTVVIPGHGTPATYAELVQYRDLMRAAHDGVRRRIANGDTRTEIIGASGTILASQPIPDALIEADTYVADIHTSLMRCTH